MEGEGHGDDGLDPLFPSTGGASSAGLNLFSQAGSSGGVGGPRAGMQGLDLNSQADDFPYIGNYQSFLQGAGPVMDSGLPPVRGNRFLGVHRRDGGWNQRGGGGGMRGRQFDFEGGGGHAGSMTATAGGAFLGGSSSRAAGHGRGIPPSGAGGGRRLNSSHTGHGRSSNHGGRSRGRGLQRGNFHNLEDDEAEDENEIEEVPQVNPKKTDKANWSDQNTSILLQLCLQQVEAGNYGDGNMNTPGYNTIIKKYKQATGLLHDRKQIKTRIGQLRGMYNFWSMLQTHTGLGRNPDGSIAADATFWKDHTEGKPWLKKLKKGDPPFLDELEAMFHREVVDGTNGYVAGQQEEEEEEEEEGEEGWEDEEEEFDHSPMSTSSLKSKRSNASTTSTANSPSKKGKKKGKSPIVKVLNKIATTYSQSVSINNQAIQEQKDSKMEAEKKMDEEIEKCQQLDWECVPNRPGYLSPYRGIKYPHAPFQNVPPPKGKKETFNHAHSKVRNVIERSFGVLKMKFRILLQMPKFSPAKQARIIVACMALHNFIRESKLSDRDFDLCDADENYVPLAEEYDSDDEPNNQQGPLHEDMDMNDFRDQIADALFHN